MFCLRVARPLRTLPYTRQTSTSRRTYAMAPTTMTLSDSRPIIISGPSGVGKGTLYKKLLDNHPTTFTTSISHTTREPRAGEVKDHDYYFVDMKTFEDLIAAGGFVEHAKFGGNRYGTSRGMIEAKRKEGKIVVLDIEMEGVKQIKSASPPFPARYIFISPPSPEFETLESRLRGRGSEKEESIQKRLAQAKLELEYSKTPGVHDIIIVNDNLEEAYKKLESFIFGKEEKTQDQPAADGEKAGISVLD